jgi:RNA polymerase sigma factor (TIGR02999 family)
MDVTAILEAVGRGDERAADRLFPAVYDELLRMARGVRAGDPAGRSLEPASLLHDAYLRLVGEREVHWQNRAHFYGAAAIAMRRILVERARRKRAVKHGGEAVRVSLDEGRVPWEEGNPDLLALDEALDRLGQEDQRAHDVVMLRFFGGLEAAEVARVLGTSEATVHRDWRFAKAWLMRELTAGTGSEPEPVDET